MEGEARRSGRRKRRVGVIRHGKWSTRVVSSGGKRFYQAYRLIDVNRVNVEGNRETRGGYYESLFDAELLAARLNEEERRNER